MSPEERIVELEQENIILKEDLNRLNRKDETGGGDIEFDCCAGSDVDVGETCVRLLKFLRDVQERNVKSKETILNFMREKGYSVPEEFTEAPAAEDGDENLHKGENNNQNGFKTDSRIYNHLVDVHDALLMVKNQLNISKSD
ncbi:unnamed protein product [Bursaphelenchus okinawaensis]|uniref:Uncharacterized protein n=1 Tax=Bursaphelenchus okinawaensis TaxID=465554 RepID=A0A811JU30_9BILA|nr:unnamed protein product [Bursaphelenchus okinawaensis]CAG9083517.1 unnamed protein product [Bursaphelenchus okinawaensis]